MTSAQFRNTFPPSLSAGTLRPMHKPGASGTLTKDQAENFRRNLARFRQEFADAIGRDFTSDEAAELADMSVDTLRSYEIGARNPRLGAMMKLAALFERPVEDFTSPSPPPRPPGWRPITRYAFKAVGLDADLQAEAIAAIEGIKRRQLDRAMAEKAKMRKGKKS